MGLPQTEKVLNLYAGVGGNRKLKYAPRGKYRLDSSVQLNNKESEK